MVYLSVRVSEGVRDRQKTVAAQRGEGLQDLVGSLVDQFLTGIERKPPDLANVLQRLRSIQGSLALPQTLWSFIFIPIDSAFGVDEKQPTMVAWRFREARERLMS